MWTAHDVTTAQTHNTMRAVRQRPTNPVASTTECSRHCSNDLQLQLPPECPLGSRSCNSLKSNPSLIHNPSMMSNPTTLNRNKHEPAQWRGQSVRSTAAVKCGEKGGAGLEFKAYGGTTAPTPEPLVSQVSAAEVRHPVPSLQALCCFAGCRPLHNYLPVVFQLNLYELCVPRYTAHL